MRRLRLFPGDTQARLGLIVLVALICAGSLGPILGIGGDPDATVGPRLAPPSLEWPFGTDNLGRSLVPRVLEGIGTTFLLTSVAALVTVAAGTVIGMVAGYQGSFVDEVVVRMADVMFSFPVILLAILVASIVGPGPASAAAAIILVTLPLMVRVVRAARLQ